MNNWPTKKLGEVCEKVKMVNPKDIFDSRFIYIDIASVDSHDGIIKSMKDIAVEDAPSRARKLVRKNDIIFSTVRPYLKNIAWVADSFDGAIASTGFCVIRAKEGDADPKYLFRLVRSNLFLSKIIPLQRGASYPAVLDADVYNIEIPIPPLEEQKRIVKRIEELTIKINEAKKLRKEVQKDTETLMSATLHLIFSEGQKSDWEEKTLHDLCVKITDGSHNPPKAVQEGKMMLSSRNIQEGKIELNPHRIISDEDYARENKRTNIRKGDLLLTIVGSIGRVAIVPSNMPPFSVQRSVAVLRPATNVNPYFLAYTLRSPDIQDFISGRARGAAQQGIYLKDVQSIRVHIPSIEEQGRIVQYLDSLSEKTKRLQILQEETSDDLNALTQLILTKAFAGEL